VAVRLRGDGPDAEGQRCRRGRPAHIVADLDLALPADSRELFTLLARRRILPSRLAARLVLMAGFRNILVHEYLETTGARCIACCGMTSETSTAS
jgi:hypothetical protein